MLSSAADAQIRFGQPGYRYDRRCERRIRQLERNVEKYMHRYGYWSHHTQKEIRKLNETRRSCGYGLSGPFWGRDDRWRDRNRRDDDWYRRNGWVWRNGRWYRRR